MHARRVAQLTHHRPGSVTPYDDVALASLTSADVEHAGEFVASELGQLAAGDDHLRRLTATLRVYLEENMSPLRAAQRLGVHENTITNRIRAAQELLPHPIEHRSPELQVALRLLRLAHET
jgi:DNA-binding PucR family transcriptional regulator